MKTAGTSVEILFERFCRPAEDYVESHGARETVTAAGIVGSRNTGIMAGDRYYHHMPASEVRDNLGPEIFDSYFKFCVMRNPYDKVVSRFWHDVAYDRRLPQYFSDSPKKFSFDKIRESFINYVSLRSGHLCQDRNVYMIDGGIAVNRFIAFENLINDISYVCSTLDITFDPNDLGSYKTDIRVRPEHYSDYYDMESKLAIEREYSFEIELFGYTF
jgi:hypothetical protein